MNTTLRNILAVIAGLILGMAANILFLILLNLIIKPPEGVDLADTQTIIDAMNAGKYQFYHFITPFVAHSSQALVGGFVATKIGVTKQKMLALIVGVLSLIGGISAVYMIPAPTWYNVVDLLFAYIPMAYLGWKLAGSANK